MKVTHIENEIRMNKDFETAVVVDNKGNIIFRLEGTKNHVKIDAESLKKAKGCILTHNHPNGWEYSKDKLRHIGTSFSEDDLKLAVFANLAEIRAVTPLYTFSMKKPEGGWGVSYESLSKYLKNENRKLRNDFYKLINKGFLSPDTASAIHFHTLCKRVAKYYNWEYNKLKTRYE